MDSQHIGLLSRDALLIRNAPCSSLLKQTLPRSTEWMQLAEVEQRERIEKDIVTLCKPPS